MRTSFLLAASLAAFSMIGLCGTASAIINGPTASTAAPQPPVANSKPKVPAVRTIVPSTSVTTSAATVTKTKPKVTGTQNLSPSTAAVATATAKAPTTSNAAAATTTTPNAAAQAASTAQGLVISNAATGTMTVGLPHGYTPQRVDDPKKDIVKQNQTIKEAEDAIANLKGISVDKLSARSDLLGPMVCGRGGGCERIFSASIFGGAGVTILIRVDKNGFPLSGEYSKLENAVRKAIDMAIDQKVQSISDAQTQMDFDYASLPLPGNGGADLHRGGPTHQQ